MFVENVLGMYRRFSIINKIDGYRYKEGRQAGWMKSL